MGTINPKSSFTSLRYRERLQATTPQRAAELTTYITDHGGTAVIDGFRVTLDNGELFWEQLPQALTRQLAFEFMAERGGL